MRHAATIFAASFSVLLRREVVVCSKLLKEAANSDVEWVVTLRGSPLAKIVGLRAGSSQRVLGGQKDTLDSRIPDSALIESDLANDWEE
jgi:antitoxin (DNA-binding transcriptional repressor) of toxin-antitoxin stability system